MKQNTNLTEAGPISLKTVQERVKLVVTLAPEVWHGEPTGKFQFSAEAMWPVAGLESEINLVRSTGAVLGRSTRSAADAVADWTRRANLDGHKVYGVLAELKKGGS
jgi:hypothetical protein